MIFFMNRRARKWVKQHIWRTMSDLKEMPLHCAMLKIKLCQNKLCAIKEQSCKPTMTKTMIYKVPWTWTWMKASHTYYLMTWLPLMAMLSCNPYPRQKCFPLPCFLTWMSVSRIKRTSSWKIIFIFCNRTLNRPTSIRLCYWAYCSFIEGNL